MNSFATVETAKQAKDRKDFRVWVLTGQIRNGGSFATIETAEQARARQNFSS